MRSPSVLIGWPLLVLLLSPCAALADNNNTSNDHASPSIAAQPNDAVTPKLPAGQPSVDANAAHPGTTAGGRVDDAGVVAATVSEGAVARPA